ncbi:hypothetical protein TNCV_3962361 [Trichonephila clavipes]|nr:hypothetical protein TNCV_3962361 [Trichonephila clavipes]
MKSRIVCLHESWGQALTSPSVRKVVHLRFITVIDSSVFERSHPVTHFIGTTAFGPLPLKSNDECPGLKCSLISKIGSEIGTHCSAILNVIAGGWGNLWYVVQFSVALCTTRQICLFLSGWKFINLQ